MASENVPAAASRAGVVSRTELTSGPASVISPPPLGLLLVVVASHQLLTASTAMMR
jgi:hypothetical protein